MASITYPNTFTNGTIADATQVNANFDAITAQVNGNLDATNIKDAAITLAKLASGVGTIEAIHYESNDNLVSYSTNPTTILSHSLTLSSARYCLILSSGLVGNSGSVAILNTYSLRDGNTTLISPESYVQGFSGSTAYTSTLIGLHYGQLASGSHTIKTVFTTAGYSLYNRLIIVQFGF